MTDQVVTTDDDRAERADAAVAPGQRTTSEDDAVAGDVAPVRFPDLGDGVAAGQPSSVHVLSDVDVAVTVELGRVRMRVRDLLSLRSGSVVELDRTAGAPVDVLVNGTPVARGEVVVVGDDLGVRITAMLQGDGT